MVRLRERKGFTTEHALHTSGENIHSTWRQNRVCSLLGLDVYKVSRSSYSITYATVRSVCNRDMGGKFCHGADHKNRNPGLPTDFNRETRNPQAFSTSLPLHVFLKDDLVKVCTDNDLESIGMGCVIDGNTGVQGQYLRMHQEAVQSFPPLRAMVRNTQLSF